MLFQKFNTPTMGLYTFKVKFLYDFFHSNESDSPETFKDSGSESF